MVYSIKAPQVGEAVHTVNILKYLKAVGDKIGVDEPIVTLETQKTALDVESPVAGTIKEFLFPEGSTVPVGENIILLLQDFEEVQENCQDQKICNVRAASQSDEAYRPVEDVLALRAWLGRKRNGAMSPRQKAHCLSNKVVPLALYKELMGLKGSKNSSAEPVQNNTAHFIDVPIKNSQTILNQTLGESMRQVVSANVQMLCNNVPLENIRRRGRQTNPGSVPSRLELIAWAVVCSLKSHPSFCSRILNTATIRQFKNPNVGIALALPDDGLTTAVVRNVFSCELPDFVENFRTSLAEAKNDDYVTGYHCLSISDMSAYGAINAVPVIAAPATATLFIGKPHLKEQGKNLFYFSLSFDHRIINGVGATLFLRDVCNNVEKNLGKMLAS